MYWLIDKTINQENAIFETAFVVAGNNDDT